ncbi:ABC transporter ATP-binding protein [Anaerolineales bacterium HSG25]|nr:ABC transporter ATP-binding protein [Anaerolineales bacterium HSG25]
MTKNSTVALQLKSLTKTFKSNTDVHIAVNNIDLDVQQGELITILGPSGCGKTTTLRLVAGFELPTSGEIILDGEVINNMSANKRPMTMVFQSYALFPHMSVFENVAFGLRIQHVTPLKEKVEAVMSLMDLAGLEDRSPHQLSGGQQQRVALARALVMEPRVLLFDEPLSNLDAKLRVHMRTEIRRLQQRLGITSLYVTHDQAEAMGLSDRIVVMNNGHIEQVGTPAEIYLKPASVFVADFMGRSNFIKSTVLTNLEGKLGLDFFGKSIALQWDERSFVPDEAVYLIIRPEAVKLTSDQKTEARLEGEVKHAEYLGSQVDYVVEVSGDHSISVIDYNPQFNQIHEEGERITLYFPTEAFHILPQS